MSVLDQFTLHDGSACPFDPNQFVELAIRVPGGIASSDVVRAKLHDWDWKEDTVSNGEIVAYRTAINGENALILFRQIIPLEG